ncbi:MAG TPA: PaaI family thioesterase [Blastocatellia bacterium]|jgi:uncharacterized protein (TIGR00369 family)
MEITEERIKAIREKFEINHFPQYLGIELDSLEPGRALLSVEVRQHLLQLQGVMHGGAIASLIDTAVAFAIISVSEPADRFTTVEMKVNYLSAIREGRAVADARLVRDGRRIVVADCDVFDSRGRLSAKGLLTYIRLNERSQEQEGMQSGSRPDRDGIIGD